MKISEDFRIYSRIGSTEDGTVRVEVKYTNGQLSITAEEGPPSNPHMFGRVNSLGRIIRHVRGWGPGVVDNLKGIESLYHLNGMQAGSPRQTEWVRTHREMIEAAAKYPRSHYEATIALMPRNINPDPEYLHDGEPYRYGSAWLSIPVPEDVLAWLRDLPEVK